jgi:hypothetical protein
MGLARAPTHPPDWWPMLTHARAATMRTSEAERQRVAEFLRDACADGRLSADELEQRLDRLFTGGTVGDIERLVWDLPGGQAVVPRLSGVKRIDAPVRRRQASSPARPAAAALICFGVAALIFFSLPPFLAVVSLAILLATGVAIALLAAALAPAGLLLLGLGWLISRLWRGRVGPHARGFDRGRGHPFG